MASVKYTKKRESHFLATALFSSSAEKYKSTASAIYCTANYVIQNITFNKFYVTEMKMMLYKTVKQGSSKDRLFLWMKLLQQVRLAFFSMFSKVAVAILHNLT